MARSPEQIEKDLAESINSSDPSWDTVQGPVRELFTLPMSGVIADTEQTAEDLRLLFSLNFEKTASEDEIRNALSNYGSTPGIGTRSSHVQHFIRYTRPRENITIPLGTLVSNATGTLVYRTTQEVVMLQAQADSYYNATRRVYEIPATVEAQGVGPEYELPAFRINTLLSQVNGIDTTENRAKSSKGLPSETTAQQTERLKEILLGLNINTQGGIRKRILDVFPSQVSMVQVVTPTDPEFQRTQFRPSIDVYVRGETSNIATETIVAIAGQTEIFPNRQPLIAINSVTINGIAAVDYTLVKDESRETRGSLSAMDLILLSIPLNTGDQVEISYTYNKLLGDVQQLVFNDSSESIFKTDYLVRSYLTVKPFISLELKVLSSYSFSEVSTNVRNRIAEILDAVVYRQRLTPVEMRDDILNNVSGIQSLKIARFRRDTGSLANIEVIVLRSNEVTEYMESHIDIKAIR